VAVGGDPPFIVRGQGSHIWDADANGYLDYIGSWGPLILGHAAPVVIEALAGAMRNGTSFGASTPAEADLAELRNLGLPHMQKVRFVSSGTEATMSAHPSRACLHKAQIHREVRRLLSRTRRLPVGESRFRSGHTWHSRVGGGSGRVYAIYACPTL